MLTNNALGIQLGRTCIGLRCDDQEFLAGAVASYDEFLVSSQPDFWIDLRLSGRRTASEIVSLLPQMRVYTQGAQMTSNPRLIECHVDWERSTLRVETESAMFAPEVDYKLMNFLLRDVYNSIHKRVWGVPPDAHLVHGCGIRDGASAYLFTGPSGAGKTTVAKLANGRTVLNDEMVLVGRRGDVFRLEGTPFDGGVAEKYNCGGDLSAVFFLKHDSSVSLRRLGRAEAFLSLLAQTLDTSALLESAYSGPFGERGDFCADLVANVPCYELGFRPDTSFWAIIGQGEERKG